eukprot:365856-Chlamydomonas_euryale.AAC.21
MHVSAGGNVLPKYVAIPVEHERIVTEVGANLARGTTFWSVLLPGALSPSRGDAQQPSPRTRAMRVLPHGHNRGNKGNAGESVAHNSATQCAPSGEPPFASLQ